MLASRRWRRPQLRTRVLIGVLAITLVALAAFDVAAVAALRRYMLGQVDAQLSAVLRPIRGPRLGPLLTLHGQPRIQTRLSIQGQYFVAFLPHHGRAVVLEEPSPIVPRVPIPRQLVTRAAGYSWTVTIPNGRTQLRLLDLPARGGSLIASANLGQIDKATDRLELIVAVGSAVACLLVALGVALVLRRGLRPIETMAAQADQITAGNLTDRVGLHDAASEVGRLGTALNGMLARIEVSVCEREASQELTRRFFADASHELRNPLASLRAHAELYRQGALPRRPQVDEAMRRIELEATRMSGLVDDMLRLARLDQHPGQHHDPVDLTALVRGCAERAQLADPGRSWQASVAADLVAVGDEELLRRAIDNILANVRTHTPDGSVASITATSDDGSVVIEVSDDGPGVPADQLPRIFDRFYRAAAPSHRPGSGLGLAIVTAIATAHNGTAQAALNHPRGLRLTLTLPAYNQSCSLVAAHELR
jgi:two-component system OmpR family sensor kinase